MEIPQPPEIFDPRATIKHLERVSRSGWKNFLMPLLASEVVERLAGIRRDFRTVVDVGTPDLSLSEAIRAAMPAAKVQHIIPEPIGRGSGTTTILDVGREALPVGSSSMDLAISALALQSVNDLPGILSQIRRALSPDGLFMGCMLGGRSLFELRDSLTLAEIEIRGGASPRVAPFVDVPELGRLLQRAGFALPVTDVDSLIVRYDQPLALMRDLRHMGATNNLRMRSRVPMRRAVLFRACQIYGEKYSDSDGRIRATFDIVWMSGWAPHESQQKPLKPGSALARLSDALPKRIYPTGD
jgi:hypothetical protein